MTRTRSPITTRPAIPSPEDIDHFTTLSEMASHGLFSDLFGRRWHVITSGLARRPYHDLSHDTAHFVEVDGRVAGMLAGYTATQKQALRSFWLVVRHAFWLLPRMALVGIPRLPLLVWFENVPPESYYISLVAIYPEFRGLGLSQTLLEIAAQSARDRGCTSLALDVNTHNISALAAYRSFGFKIVGTSPRVICSGEDTALHRMVMALS